MLPKLYFIMIVVPHMRLAAMIFYSDLRQIPDNQEVFAHPSTDQSIIVEIMEYQTAEDDIQAIR